jgi:hypothetical protein
LADYGNDFLRQIEGAVAVFRMAVVPGNKLESGMAAGQLFAGNAETPVRLGAARKHHRVIAGAKLLDRYAAPDRHIG